MDPHAHAHDDHGGHGGHDDHIHPEPTTFLSKYVFSFDHKVIAKQFLWLGLFFLLFGGTMAMMIRWQLANPGVPFPVIGKLVFGGDGRVTPAAYTSLFTMHGTIMIFFAITPIMIGAYGNYCIPLMIGARDMVFPTLNMLSFWTMMISTGVLVSSFFVPMGAGAAGWTAYPPLSTQVGTPGAGQTLLVLSLFLAGASTIMGAVNYITTVIRLRAPGMTYFKMPITVWGLWLTAILNALFVPGARLGPHPALPRPHGRHQVLHRRRARQRRRGPAPLPAPVLDSSATRRSTSSSSRSGAWSRTCSRSSPESPPTATR